MNVKKIISDILPEDLAKMARYKYRIFRQRLYRPISEEFFRNLLTQKFGIKEGDTLFIHSSMDFLNLDFSPFRLLKY